IELRDVRFGYASSSADVLSGISLAFERGAKVALVGPTGSGKSTLIDIMVGLLLPTSGALLVDGEAVTAQNAAGWRRNVAYVPQDGFLFDQSIASNIAFGVPAADIDMDRVRWAARIAQIDDFISGELPEQYDTLVGERGVRLSGGQRQRVGLARAFYRRPPVLLLDEATSALDGATEAAVMAGVYEEFPDVTVIMIAHRLSTVRSADRVFLIDRGALRASGTYDELLAGDAQFRGMVELSGPGDGEPA
ncbi:MAG: ATP-binding cassette domain-containing protein, partial [Gammaproteobacteria bacterium]|nr:ATP-binding cassette domain-containing protein [Gammaproteobacteria bacterium]